MKIIMIRNEIINLEGVKRVSIEWRSAGGFYLCFTYSSNTQIFSSVIKTREQAEECLREIFKIMTAD